MDSLDSFSTENKENTTFSIVVDTIVEGTDAECFLCSFFGTFGRKVGFTLTCNSLTALHSPQSHRPVRPGAIQHDRRARMRQLTKPHRHLMKRSLQSM